MDFYQEPEENRIQNIVNWIVDVVVVIAFACYLVYALGSRIEVNGSSMSPQMNSGDEVLINRLAYDFGSPKRYDVAVFAKEDSSYNIKRIIGLPGETVQIKENHIYINGTRLDDMEEFGLVTIAGAAEYPIELAEDEYFLLGDNRESSEDSRFAGIGNIKSSQLIGKVWLKFQPFDELGFIK